MNDILKTYMERFRENRHTLRRYTAFVLALAMITTLFVNWQLHGVGISMTAQYQCGEEEHAHTADCYTKVLTCGYNEGDLENAAEVAAAEADQPSAEDEIMPLSLEPQIEFVPHEHTDDCYTEVQTLTCMEEEHVHGDDCFDPEDGSLICDKFEHTHDESCYTTEYELTCGLEEGELVEQVVEPTQSAALAAMAAAKPVALEPVVDTVEPIYHHHTDACYEEVLTCPLPEHQHTVACLSDTSADLETPEEWQAANAEAVISGNWAEDLLSVAKTQLGYEQSEKNFEIDPADGVTLRYYSRYGQSYGNPYGEWDVMFLSYCLKYAGIPQSAIPQEASVLALRSSMSDMEWLLDGEDGSSADVGDIVIYNKYVTRTVAVDSSADGAADGLDDQFSMDAEGENGAEPEESGTAALDTAPAADSVTTPDTPDTAVPSVVSPTAEPQTTTVTDAQPVETVGIVSSVDSDADTLTVISGDVDGKVAEVTLSNAEVLGVVSVAYAQYANEMLTTAVTGALRAPSMLTLAGEGDTTASTPTTYLDHFEETRTSKNGGITKYTYHVGEEEKQGNFTVTAGKTLYFDFNYTIASGVLKEGQNTLTYKLPEAIWPKTETRAEIKTDDGKVVGEQVFKTDGTTVLTFDLNSEGFNPNEPFSGHFKYEWKYLKEDATKQQTITFPGSGTTITLEKLEDIDIKKSQPNVYDGTITETANGETKLSYKVTVSSKNGWSKNIYIWDGLTPDSNFISADYDHTSFELYKVKSDGTKTEVKDFTPDFNTKDKKYKDYAKTFQINDLPALEAGESYELTYDVLTTRTNSATLKNTARTNDNKQANQKVNLDGNRLWKDGQYDEATKRINWTVTVNNPSASDLTKYVVTDTLESGKIIGDVTLSVQQDRNGTWSSKQIATITDAKDQSGFTYKFSDLNNEDDRCAMRYVFTYQSTVPEGSTSVKNKVEYGNKNKFTTEKDVSIPNSGSGSGSGSGSTEIKPMKTASGTLTPSTENPYLLTAPWTITADIPGKGVYTFSDRITNSSGWFNDKEVIYHYGIANELQQQLVNNLTITYVENGETKTLRCSDLSDLKNKGISFAVKYYQYEWSGSPIDASDNSTPVRAFEVTLDTTQCKLDLKKLTLNYSTRVDGTNLPDGTRVTIKNQINYDNSVKYEYQKPSSELKMTKGVRLTSNKKAEDYGKCYSPDASSGGTLYKDYAKFLEGGMLEYQVLLDFSSVNTSVNTLPDTITLTDTLPKGLTYFTNEGEPSASIVFINGYGKNSKYKDLPLKDSEETTSLKNYFRTEGRLVVTEPDEASEDGQTLTFKITDLDKIDFAKLKAEGYTELVLRYRAQLTDTRWSSLRFENATYTNKVKWEEHSELEDDVNVYVKQTSKVLTKDSEQVDGQSRAKYTLIINPAAKNLHEGSNTITLTDTLTVKNKFVQASLDIFSVHLYNTETNQEIQLSEYSYTQPKQTTDKNDYPVYTTTFTLPDERPLKLVYEYVTTANGKVELENKAEVEGANSVKETTELESVGSESGVSQAPLTVYKVDKRNYSLYLTGAGFTLERFDSNAGTWQPVNELTEYMVDKKGTLTFHFAGKDALQENTLYKLTEVTAPEGYSVASQPYYFIYQGVGKSQDDAYQTAVGGHTGEGIPTQTDENLLFCANGKSSKLFVPNTANSLTIIKNWKNKDGSFLRADQVNMDTVDVQLYCYPNGNKAAEKLYKKVQLTKADGWTTTVPIDNEYREGYIFFIKETNVSASRFTVAYDQPEGVQVGGTLTFTNTDTGFSNYELPSTGGTGTLPFTAVGGTMMLSALAYSFIHHKRRREGRADD